MRKIFFVVFFSLISGYVFSAPELKGSPQELKEFLYPSYKIITIKGEAEEKAYSDKAIISLVITTEDKLLSKSLSSNGLLREKITSSLINIGIDSDSIKSSKFSSSPEYGWFGSKPSRYRVINRMAISIMQEVHLKEIATVADQYKEVELSDATFEHTKKDEHNKKIKAKALTDVIRQKEFYEQTLGLKLSPIGIRDSTVHQHATRGAMALESVIRTAAGREKSSYSSVAKHRAPDQAQSFDEVKYEANISVDFKIDR